MMTYEIGMTDPSDSSPAIDGLVTFLSFVTFGSIPLIPYFLFDAVEKSTFTLSCWATGTALLLLGLLRGRTPRPRRGGSKAGAAPRRRPSVPTRRGSGDAARHFRPEAARCAPPRRREFLPAGGRASTRSREPGPWSAALRGDGAVAPGLLRPGPGIPSGRPQAGTCPAPRTEVQSPCSSRAPAAARAASP